LNEIDIRESKVYSQTKVLIHEKSQKNLHSIV